VSDTPTPRRIAIVGGGITGLAAAHEVIGRARELGRPVAVTVLERAARFGGNLVTERSGGFLLDGGPDSWVVTKPHATALARELGLGGAVVSTNPQTRRFYIAWGGHLHPVPEGLVLGVPTKLAPLVRSRLFSPWGKLRMAFEPIVPTRRFARDDDESIADFARRRLGRQAAERMVAPLLGGISAGDAGDLSVRAAFPQLVAMERDHGSLVRGLRAAQRARAKAEGTGRDDGAFRTLEGGVADLVRVLADRLRAAGVTLRKNAIVTTLARSGREWTLGVREASATNGSDRVVVADAVLLAAPAYVAADLLGAGDAELGRGLGAIPFGSTATVFLGYRRADVKRPLDGVGFVVPRALGRSVLASTWVSSKWQGRAPEGHVLLRVFFGDRPGESGERPLEEPDDAMVLLARNELRDLMGLDADPVLSRVFRFERGSPQMRVGHLARMRSLRERLAESAPGVWVAGGGYDGIGIPDCIRQGQEAGRAMLP
jgi:oxygen-dependent protoporphyrinogen oxidase